MLLSTLFLCATLASAGSPEDAPPPEEASVSAPPAAPELADASAPAAPVGLVGLADLHLHQWAEFEHARRWYYGSAQGIAPIAMQECGMVVNNRTAPRDVHGQFLGRVPNRTNRMLSKWGLGDERSDDIRGKHGPPGISNSAERPHWLGWPTSDSLAHQQSWEGWLKLAHDGAPFLYFLEHGAGGPHTEIGPALRAFYRDYETNMAAAFDAGFAGLNLAVVSLVHSNMSCRSLTPKKAQGETAAACNDMDSVHRQYEAALEWAQRNGSWAEVVTDPNDAREAVAAGKLAIVLSIEASDLLGPSELIGDGAFRTGYHGAIEVDAGWFGLGGPNRQQRVADVNNAVIGVPDRIEAYLDLLPEVTTLQPAHQLDNPFSGAALVANTLLHSQQWREVRLSTCADARRQVRLWKYEEQYDHSAYVDCWTEAILTPGKPGLRLGVKRLTAPLPPKPYSVPADYATAFREQHLGDTRSDRKQTLKQLRADTHPSRGEAGEDEAFSGDNLYRNPYGLSSHGELLVDAMVSRGMPIDASHMSWEAVRELDEHLPEGYPIYLSHAFPLEWELTSREQNSPSDVVARVKARGGLVGVRPGDDEIRLHEPADGELSTSRFRDLLVKYDCMGTSMGTGLFQSAFHAQGVQTAFGTDLNGFINQPQPAAQLRPGYYAAEPCAATIRSIGSEVSQRGLAHVGLLSQLYVEMLMQTDPDDGSEATVQALANGAEAYVAMWERASAHGADGEPAPKRAAGPVASAAAYAELLYDGEQLKTIAVDGRLTLPRWRAIEAVLPYVGPQRERMYAYPQLPTQIGFLLGLQTYGIYPETYHFPVERCRRSGVLVKKGRRDACAEIEDAKDVLKASHAPSYELPEQLAKWDHVYPQSKGTEFPFTKALAQVPLVVEERPGVGADFPSFDPVRDWVLRPENQRCLREESFVRAPPPGLHAGFDPAAWVARVREDDAKDAGLACYCALLDALDDAALLARDRAALASCGRAE